MSVERCAQCGEHHAGLSPEDIAWTGSMLAVALRSPCPLAAPLPTSAEVAVTPRARKVAGKKRSKKGPRT